MRITANQIAEDLLWNDTKFLLLMELALPRRQAREDFLIRMRNRIANEIRKAAQQGLPEHSFEEI